MPQDAGRPGRPWNDHRTTLEGIIWRFRTGSPWRDLPDGSARISRCGNGIGCGRRTARTSGWSPRCASRPELVGRDGGDPVDRLHRCAGPPARCRRAAGLGRRGPRAGHRGQDRIARIRVVPGEPPDHALGRSRGGLTTKVHALSDLTCTPVLALLTAGQAGDNPMLAPADRRPSPSPGTTGHFGCWRTRRTRTRAREPTCAQTDQAHHPRTQRPDRAPQGQGLHGWAAARVRRRAKSRNTVERSFNRFKQWRGLATRYDKYAVTYLGGVLLGLIVMTHRLRSSPDAPSSEFA